MKLTKRQFTVLSASFAFAGLSKLNASMLDHASQGGVGYGPLNSDPDGLIDLPEGFTYKVISSFGDTMTDGFRVPNNADGMGCFKLDNQRVALVRNHELSVSDAQDGPNPQGRELGFKTYDKRADGVDLPGGTTTIIYNLDTGKVENEFISLLGTIRNCSGGITPWGSWLTCEENVSRKGDEVGKDHGWVFEVPAIADGPIEPNPIKGLGRFNHEAAAIDPRTGIVYLTEDRDDSLFYRFIPKVPGKLHAGGKLQALGFKTQPKGGDSRNWDSVLWDEGDWIETFWIDLEDTDSPNDDLRRRGHSHGAAIFARGEGIHWGDDELYFCCTSGGRAILGQVMRYVPSKFEGTEKEHNEPGKIQLFLESESTDRFNFGDNITVAPNGHLIVCEDQYTENIVNQIKGITPEGKTYSLATIRIPSEPAGACFSPDGTTMFVNVYGPTRTLAITGPWKHLDGAKG